MKKRQEKKIRKAYAKFHDMFPFDDPNNGNNTTNLVATVYHHKVVNRYGHINMSLLNARVKTNRIEEHRYQSDYPHLEHTWRYRKAINNLRK